MGRGAKIITLFDNVHKDIQRAFIVMGLCGVSFFILWIIDLLLNELTIANWIMNIPIGIGGIAILLGSAISLGSIFAFVLLINKAKD